MGESHARTPRQPVTACTHPPTRHPGEPDHRGKGGGTPLPALHCLHPDGWGAHLRGLPGVAQVGDDSSPLPHSQVSHAPPRGTHLPSPPSNRYPRPRGLRSPGATPLPPTHAPLEPTSPAPFSPSPIAPSRSGARSGPLCRRRNPSVRVVLGAQRLEEPEESQQVFGIAESIAHPHYNPRSVDNDIRLLRVSPARAAGHRRPARREVVGTRWPGGGVPHAPRGAGGRWGAPRPAGGRWGAHTGPSRH